MGVLAAHEVRELMNEVEVVRIKTNVFSEVIQFLFSIIVDHVPSTVV